ncbi:MAG TPA: hypothetical protein VJC13_02490 [Candidatus Paceibacterota bacterium]
MKKHISILTPLLFILPTVALAAFDGVKGLLSAFGGILGTVIPIIFGIALIYFFWGSAQFILESGDVKKREDGKQKMIWGIVALFVMFSIYGILRFIGVALGISVGTSDTPLPSTPISGYSTLP